jgi:hypothetical protein
MCACFVPEDDACPPPPLPFRVHQVVMTEKLLTATIERGMPSDYEIVFERESEQSPVGNPLRGGCVWGGGRGCGPVGV